MANCNVCGVPSFLATIFSDGCCYEHTKTELVNNLTKVVQMDWLSLGSSPMGEDCVQLGTPDYARMASAELRRYRDLLEKRFPQLAEKGCKLVNKSFDHDFGRYSELTIEYNPSNTAAEDYALFVEGNLPETWEDEEVCVFS